MTDRTTVSVLVASTDSGFSLYRLRGPFHSVMQGRHYSKFDSDKLAWGLVNALHSIPYALFAKRIHGPVYADKKITVLVKSCDDGFLKQMKQLDEMPEGTAPEWDALKTLRERFDFKLKKVAGSNAAIEYLQAFHKPSKAHSA